jgi:hypothetical protein
VSNEIIPALGEGADERPVGFLARNIVHETQLLRDQLLERPRRRRRRAMIIAILGFAMALVGAGFVMFTALA